MPHANTIIRQLKSSGSRLCFEIVSGRCQGNRIGYELALDDGFETVILDLVENQIQMPFLRVGQNRDRRKYILQRGAELARIVFPEGHRSSDEGQRSAFILIGNESLFGQAWETLWPDGDREPWALGRPLIRILENARAYPIESNPLPLRRIVAICARLSAGDISFRTVVGPLAAIAEKDKAIQLSVVSPSYPNLVEDALALDAGAQPIDILHLDAHGELLTYDDLSGRFGEQRALFESQSWGLPVTRYQGEKPFVLLNWDAGPLPVSGHELGSLAKQAGVQAVVMNACRAGALAAGGSFVLDLIRAGVPEAVAVRHRLSPQGARLFVGAFYGAIAKQGSVADAVCAARQAMYEGRFRTYSGDTIEVDDWLSLVHYAVEHPAPRESKEIRPAPEVPLFLPLPNSIEALMKDIIDRVMLAKAGEIAGEPLPENCLCVLAGALGLSQARILTEIAHWLGRLVPWYSDTCIFDASGLLPAKLESAVRARRSDEIAASIESQAGRHPVVLIQGVDIAVDRGIRSPDAAQDFANLARSLGDRNWATLYEETRDNWALQSKNLPCVYPMQYSESITYFRDWHKLARSEEQIWLLELIACASGGFNEIVLATLQLKEPDHLVQLLDLLVFGDTPSEPVQRLLAPSYNAAFHRYRPLSEDKDYALSGFILATLGAGVRLADIPPVCDHIASQGIRLGESRDREAACYRQLAKLRRTGLATTSHPESWLASVEDSIPDVLVVNPWLKSITTSQITRELGPIVNNFTLFWAASKMKGLAFGAQNPDTREDCIAFFEHARPLFAAAAWTLEQTANEGEHAIEFRKATRWANAAGLWPSSLTFQEDISDGRPSEHDSEDEPQPAALWSIGKQLHRSAKLSEARETLTKAAEQAGAASLGTLRTAVLVSLAGVLIDSDEVSEAERVLLEARQSFFSFGPASEEGEISYESALVLQRQDRPKDAEARYKETIELARHLAQHDLECRCFQNLAAMALEGHEFVPPVRRTQEQSEAIDKLISHAEDYLNRAELAAARGGEPEYQEPAHKLLRGHLAWLKGEENLARQLLTDAALQFEQQGDARSAVARNLLRLVEIMQGGEVETA